MSRLDRLTYWIAFIVAALIDLAYDQQLRRRG